MSLLLVTRPEPQASTWAQALRQAGVNAQALPLIAITAAPHPEAVSQLWRDLPQVRALMFVSPAAVEGFFQLRPPGAAWPGSTLATAPGPGTANALRQLGAPAGLQPEQVVSPQADAEQFDSEALWPLLAPLDWSGQRVSIVSGGDASGAQGRTWLTERWREAGATVNTVQTYLRGPGNWTPAQQALAHEALTQDESCWLLSSSQALDFLLDHHLPGLEEAAWQPHSASRLRVLCTHPRIAQHAEQRGIGHIDRCAPTLASVVQARRSAS